MKKKKEERNSRVKLLLKLVWNAIDKKRKRENEDWSEMERGRETDGDRDRQTDRQTDSHGQKHRDIDVLSHRNKKGVKKRKER